MLSALIGAGASLLGGFMSNQASAASADKQMDFQAQQTAAQQAFQERMSNTAHQREVTDLRLAGLNPILSVSKGGPGASTPAGASAQGAAYQARNPVEGAASSALQALTLDSVMADIQVKEAQRDNIKAQTLTEINKPENIFADTQLKQTQKFREGHEGVRAASQTDLNAALEKQAEVATTIAKTTGIPLAQAQAAAAAAMASLSSASAKSADVKARLDAAYGEAERLISMGEGATSAVSNLVPKVNIFNKTIRK